MNRTYTRKLAPNLVGCSLIAGLGLIGIGWLLVGYNSDNTFDHAAATLSLPEIFALSLDAPSFDLCRLSPSGATFALGDHERLVVYETSGHLRWQRNSRIDRLCFSPDEYTILSWDQDNGALSQFSVDTGSLLGSVRYSRPNVIQMLMADGERDAVYFSHEDGTIFRLELSTGTERLIFDSRWLPEQVRQESRPEEIIKFTISHDGMLYVAIGPHLCKFDLRTQSLLWNTRLGYHGLRGIVLRTDDRIAIVGDVHQDGSRIFLIDSMSGGVTEQVRGRRVMLYGNDSNFFFEYDEQAIGRDSRVAIRRFNGESTPFSFVAPNAITMAECSADGSVLLLRDFEGWLRVVNVDVARATYCE